MKKRSFKVLNQKENKLNKNYFYFWVSFIGEGGVIYVDYDIVTADYSIVDRNDINESQKDDIAEPTDEEEDNTVDKIDNVMEHNNQLVDVMKNTLEMQAFLFDKLFSYLF